MENSQRGNIGNTRLIQHDKRIGIDKILKQNKKPKLRLRSGF